MRKSGFTEFNNLRDSRRRGNVILFIIIKGSSTACGGEFNKWTLSGDYSGVVLFRLDKRIVRVTGSIKKRMIIQKEILIDGFPRTYKLFVPKKRSAENNFLLLSLHGAGGNSDISIYESSLDERAAKDGFIIAFPDALTRDKFQKDDFKNNPRIWQAKAIDGIESYDLVFISELIKFLVKEYNIKYVFATGFSNGAIMCSYLALKIPGQLTAIAPVCGKLVSPSSDIDAIIPTLLIVGDSDPLFPITGGKIKLLWGNTMEIQPLDENLTAWIDLISPPREIRSINTENYNSTSYKNNNTELKIIKIFNHGHIWPGGKSKLTYRIVGKPNRNVSANDLILEFFKKLF
jgi:polyhydroxybutyrate depolymerase